jgi:hypothetical protein
LHRFFVKAFLVYGIRVNGSSLLTTGDLKVAGLLEEASLSLKLCRRVIISGSFLVDRMISRKLATFWLTMIVLQHLDVVVLAKFNELLCIDGGLDGSCAFVVF